MYFVITETTVRAYKQGIRRQYYNTLLVRVKQQPGFIKDIRFGSPSDPEKGLLIARFVDETSLIA
jgi:hypothetical protein